MAAILVLFGKVITSCALIWSGTRLAYVEGKRKSLKLNLTIINCNALESEGKLRVEKAYSDWRVYSLHIALLNKDLPTWVGKTDERLMKQLSQLVSRTWKRTWLLHTEPLLRSL